MKVLFVYSVFDVHSPKKPLRSPDDMQFGISQMSSLLKQHGHETNLIVLGRPLGRRNCKIVDRRIAEFEPQLVCLTAVSSEYPFVEKIARYFRARLPKAYLVLGGVHASLNACDEMLGVFDALCVGEGEYPTLELATQLENGEKPSGIANLWIRHNGTIQKNPTRPFLENLDRLPPPDRQMWHEWTDVRPESRRTVLLGRGCPFGCTFCSNHALRRVSTGSYVRLRSVESIVEEVSDLKAMYPKMNQIYLEIESFVTYTGGGSSSTNIAWAVNVCEALEDLNRSFVEPLSYGFNLRIAPGIDFDRLFAASKRANVAFVNVGLESGSERIRSHILNRNYSNDEVRNVVASARRHGLRVVFYNMVGLPGETLADFQETVRINRECQPDWYYLEIFYPYPGTELHRLCTESGLVQGTLNSRMERSKALMDLPGFSRQQIQDSYTWFDFHVHRGKKPLWKILPHVAARKAKSYPGLFYIYRRSTRHGPLRRLKEMAKRA
jgi:radical SAM superfamily enzyme